MSVTYPDGYITLDDPLAVPSEVAAGGFDAAILAALATAYFAAKARLSSAAENGSRAQWGRIAGVSDDDLRAWMTYWDSLLDTSASRQASLTSSYARAQLRNGGVTAEPSTMVRVDPQMRTGVDRWLASKYANIADDSLRAQVQTLRQSMEAESIPVRDAARADRVRWLHSPIIAARSQMADGVGDAPTVLADLTGRVAEYTSDHLRSVERGAVGAIGWPTFKDGRAMMYRRIPHAGACGWCVAVATRLYAVESFQRSAAWHAACRCSWQLVSEAEVRAYADTLSRTDGNYLAAARAAGMYDGDTTLRSSSDLVTRRFDPKAAATEGYVSREATAEEKTRLAQERARREAGIRNPSRDGYSRTSGTSTVRTTGGQTTRIPNAATVAEADAVRRRALTVKRQAIALLNTDPARAAELWAEQKRLFDEAARLAA